MFQRFAFVVVCVVVVLTGTILAFPHLASWLTDLWVWSLKAAEWRVSYSTVDDIEFITSFFSFIGLVVFGAASSVLLYHRAFPDDSIEVTD